MFRYVQVRPAPCPSRLAADPLQINHQSNPLKSFLLQLFISGLKRAMPEHRWSGYMIAGGEWGGVSPSQRPVICLLSVPQLKEPLGVTNKHVGYIYLVDPACKIRWAGNAYATEEERAGLRKAVAVLMARVREGKEGEAQAAAEST